MKYLICTPETGYTYNNTPDHIPRVGEIVTIDDRELIVDEVCHNYDHNYIWLGTEYTEHFKEEIERAGSLEEYLERLEKIRNETD